MAVNFPPVTLENLFYPQTLYLVQLRSYFFKEELHLQRKVNITKVKLYLLVNILHNSSRL